MNPADICYLKYDHLTIDKVNLLLYRFTIHDFFLHFHWSTATLICHNKLHVQCEKRQGPYAINIDLNYSHLSCSRYNMLHLQVALNTLSTLQPSE